MKSFPRVTSIATAVIFVGASMTVAAQDLPTTGSLETRSGKLEVENGYPRAATVEKIFDDIDYQRACQAYLWALPLMAMQQWQNEHLTKFEAGKCDYVDYLTFQVRPADRERDDSLHHGISKSQGDGTACI